VAVRHPREPGTSGGTVFSVATYISPLSLQSVGVAAVIILLPGRSLTNAVCELSSEDLESRTARFAGPMATMLKLTFGTVPGTQIAHFCTCGVSIAPARYYVSPASFFWCRAASGFTV